MRRGDAQMVRAAMLVGLTCWLSMLSGCRCFPAMEKYHSVIDCVSDKDWILWERMYYPPWDASRAGRPDWCWSSWNRKLCPCRCQQGLWGGYCDQQHYPPNHPYSYPSQAIPLHGSVLMPRSTKKLPDVMRTPEYPGVSPEETPPAPKLDPAPQPNPPESGAARRSREDSWLPTSARKMDGDVDGWMELE